METPATYAANAERYMSDVIGGRNAKEIAHKLVKKYGDIREIAREEPGALCEFGVSRAGAKRLQAALRLAECAVGGEKHAILSPDDVAKYVGPMSMATREEFVVIALDTRNNVLDVFTVYKGTSDGVNIRMKEVFEPAIRIGAKSVIVVHNHPSGDTKPSSEDVRATSAMVRAGEMLDIEVLDSIIVGNSIYSMKENGLM